MRAGVGASIEAFALEFDEAASHAHALTQMGVTATDTATTMIRRSSKTTEAWLLFQDKWSPVLDRVAAVRLRLSVVLGVEPVVHGTEFTAAFATPFVPPGSSTSLAGPARLAGGRGG